MWYWGRCSDGVFPEHHDRHADGAIDGQVHVARTACNQHVYTTTACNQHVYMATSDSEEECGGHRKHFYTNSAVIVITKGNQRPQILSGTSRIIQMSLSIYIVKMVDDQQNNVDMQATHCTRPM